MTIQAGRDCKRGPNSIKANEKRGRSKEVMFLSLIKSCYFSKLSQTKVLLSSNLFSILFNTIHSKSSFLFGEIQGEKSYLIN